MEKKQIYCPECGSKTVIELVQEIRGVIKIRRCDGLIDTHPNKPLEACTWSEELIKK